MTMRSARIDGGGGTIAAITLSAIAAGVVMAIGAVSLFCIVALGEPASFVLSFAPIMALTGAVMGLVSAAYLVPLLKDTRLAVSLPVVLGASAVIAIGAGTLNPLLGAIAGLMAQVALSCAFHATRPGTRLKPSECLYCGFDCLGVVADVCPECGLRGPPRAARLPDLCRCCEKGRVTQGRCPACDAVDVNSADGRAVLKEKR